MHSWHWQDKRVLLPPSPTMPKLIGCKFRRVMQRFMASPKAPLRLHAASGAIWWFPTILSDCKAFAAKQREYGLEYRIMLPDRGVRWIETRCFISYDGEGLPQRVVGVNIDVTERRRMEQTITDRNRQLELA